MQKTSAEAEILDTARFEHVSLTKTSGVITPLEASPAEAQSVLPFKKTSSLNNQWKVTSLQDSYTGTHSPRGRHGPWSKDNMRGDSAVFAQLEVKLHP
jgi:hypothetical protein